MVELEEEVTPQNKKSQACQRHGLYFFALGVVFLFSTASAIAGLNLANPTTFFTNIASRLLRSEFQIDLSQIQIYPTNQYTPAVNRLLQVSANLYDSTTNRSETAYPFLPTVFRPLFRRNDQGAVWISGYREVTNTDVAMLEPIDLENPSDSWTNIPPSGTTFDPDDLKEPMVCGVPLIIGTKKGYPNFNALGSETAITVSRTLQFHRPAPYQPVNQTNQIYALTISNSLGLQAWNSYGTAFPRALTVIASGKIDLTLSNEFGLVIGPDNLPLTKTFLLGATTNIPAGAWPGFTNVSSKLSFLLPILGSNQFLPRSLYVQDGTAEGTRFTNALVIQDPTNTFRIPQWKLNTKTRLRFVIVDTSANRIVDYVNLMHTGNQPDLIDIFRGLTVTCGYIMGNSNPDPGSFWCNNRPGISDDLSAPTYGILNQIDISAGIIYVSDAYWRSYNLNVTDKIASIDAFQVQLYDLTTNLNFETPFNPKRTFYQYVDWQANDPLIHRTVADLTDPLGRSGPIDWDSGFQSPIKKLTSANPLSYHYRPWGGNPNNPNETSVPTQFNPALKDPLIRRSDDWNFPSGEPLTFATLGRIHRGTPWQTIYLKSLDSDLNTWSKWSGNLDYADAASARPVNDWQLVSLLDQLFDTDPRPRLSINTSDSNAWLGILDGLSATTNAQPESELTISSNSNQAILIANAMFNGRVARPPGYFQSLGDILSIPELSSASPFLNTNSWNYNAPSETSLEQIPGQLLPLVRVDSVGSARRDADQIALRFTGYDDYPYAVEISTDLLNWIGFSTNFPNEGCFSFTNSAVLPPRFFRSKLLSD